MSQAVKQIQIVNQGSIQADQDVAPAAFFDASGKAVQVGGGGGSTAWVDITNKPTTFPPQIGTTGTTAAAGNHTHAAATTSAPGLMSAADKAKLDGVAANANAYSLPAATTTANGGVKKLAAQADSTATDAAGLVADFNALLAKLKTAGLM